MGFSQNQDSLGVVPFFWLCLWTGKALGVGDEECGSGLKNLLSQPYKSVMCGEGLPHLSLGYYW